MNVSVHPVKAPFLLNTPPTEIAGERLVAATRADVPAIYHSSVPSNDEGWTRWIFDSKTMAYGVLTDKELRAGITSTNRIRRHRQVLHDPVPGSTGAYLLEGYRAARCRRNLRAVLERKESKDLRDFVETGGTLVFLNRASNFAIEQFKLPLCNVVAGLPSTDFYVPGSILRIQLDTSHPIAAGMQQDTIAWVEDSTVFEVIEDPNASVPAANVE